MENKDYIVIVQCHIVKERCSGYFCEASYSQRSGEFSAYPKDKEFRTLYFTCGGCCGRAIHRKVANLLMNLKRKESTGKENVVVHLSSCITKDSYHGPRCPHLDYLVEIIRDKLKVDLVLGTKINDKSEKLRKDGQYKS